MATKKTEAEKNPPPLDITVDRASKFYEPGEMVTGAITLKDLNFADLTNCKCEAFCLMDTVS